MKAALFFSLLVCLFGLVMLNNPGHRAALALITLFLLVSFAGSMLERKPGGTSDDHNIS